MCVNAPLPVMSPIAQSPVAGAHPLVDVERPGVRVEPDGLQAEVGEVGPCARPRRAACRRSAPGRRRSTVNCPSAYDTDDDRSPRSSTWMPSPANDLGDQRRRPPAPPERPAGRRPRPRVTRTPNRANTCASSAPIAPPPMHDQRRRAASSSLTASRLVQYGVSASPSIGGAAGRGAGVEHDALRRGVRRRRRPRPRAAPVSRPRPRTNVAPACPPAASTATVSSQSSVASSRIRVGDRRPVGLDRRRCRRGRRRGRPRRAVSAARIIILVGTQPK